MTEEEAYKLVNMFTSLEDALKYYTKHMNSKT